MTFNPYHQWLGLDPRLKNPHYFQLLGVSSKVQDEAEYAKQVKAAAQAKLAILNSIADEENASIRDQVRQRIMRASAVLADTQRRLEYIQGLKSKSSDTTPPVVANSPVKNSPSHSPRARNSTDLLPPKTSSQSSIPLAEKISTSEFSHPTQDLSQIPMAIPIQKPSVTNSTEIVDSTLVPTVSPESINDVDVEIPMRLKPVRKRRKSKLGFLGAISMILITAISVTGLYFIIDRLAPSIFSKVEAESTGTSGEAGENPPLPDLETIANEVLEQGLPEETEADRDNAVTDDSLRTADANGNSEDHTDSDKGLENAELVDADSDAMESNSAEGDMIDGEPTVDLVKPAGPAKALTDLESLELVSRLRQIRRSLFRRDRESVSRHINDTQRRVDKLLDPKLIPLDASQLRLRKHFEATKSAVELLDGFWAQVVSSSLAMPGGQEISVNDQIVGLVEGAEEYVVLRIAGSNINFRYEYLPAGLAVKIAEMGAIKDVPSWRLYLAAFLGLQTDAQERHADRIEELIKESIADGHDATLLLEFLNDDFSDVSVGSKPELPDEAEISELLKDFQASANSKNPAKVKPQAASRLAERLLTMVADSPSRAIAYAYHARELATQAGDAFLVEDAVAELAHRADVDQNELLLESLAELSKNRLDTAQSRKLMETAIPVLKSVQVSAEDKKKIKELVQRLSKLAETHQFIESQRRIGQLDLK